MYAHGWGVPRDPLRGFEMTKELADERDLEATAIAQANVGMFYLEGAGVERSPEKAREYLEKAVSSGVERAAAFAAELLEDIPD
jgi:TPR repeat protein